MKVSRIGFSRWKQWGDRDSLNEALNFPGIYLLAHYQRWQSGPAKPLTSRVVYIGETCKQTLKRRLNQFENSGFSGKPGHSGGRTYWKKFKGKTSAQLFVAVLPVKLINVDIRPYFIRYVERKLIWEYARKYNSPPLCNLK
ncbi:hypothetical protein ACFL4N_04135 [Thermodesulfobacteriota bacterium]